METLYSDHIITIAHHPQLNILCGDWKTCQNNADYWAGVERFNHIFYQKTPENTYWGNQRLNFRLDDELQNRTKVILKEQSKKQGDFGKTAMVFSDEYFSDLGSQNLFDETNPRLNLRYFQRRNDAFNWLATPLREKNSSGVPEIKIKEIEDNEYQLSLKVNKKEIENYIFIFKHVLRNRDFCLRNAKNFNALTVREREILSYIIKGFKNMDIADDLFLSVETIKTHRKNILHKLQCKNTYELTHYQMMLKEYI